MADLSALSTEELLKMRGGAPAVAAGPDLSKLSTEELMKMRPAAPPETGYMANMKNMGMAGLRGYFTGGMGGAAAGMMTEGSKQLEHAAYDAGGAVTDVAAKTGMPPQAAAGIGTAANVGIQSIPALMGGGVGSSVGKLAAPVMESLAAKSMHSALKPGTKYAKDGADAGIVGTLLDEGINVSKGGVEKLHKLIGDLNTAIKEAIGGSTATVDKNAVASRLGDTLKRFETQVNPAADTKAIEAAETEFRQHPMFNGDAIPVQLAQDLKQGTYRVLKGKYGEQGSASTEAQKGLARGLKEEIATAVPEVAPLNARESKILDALTPLERRVLVEGNKNPISLGTTIGTLTHNPAAIVGLWANSSAFAKSLIARVLNFGSEAIPQTAGAATGATLGSMLGKPDERKQK